MKHLSRCVPATLSLIFSLTPPGGLLADTSPILPNNEVTVSLDLPPIAAPQSSLLHRFDEQPRIILATGFGSLGRNVSKGAKAATKTTPAPPRPKSAPPGSIQGKGVDANNPPSPPPGQPSAYPNNPPSPPLDSPENVPGYTGLRTNPPVKPPPSPPPPPDSPENVPGYTGLKTNPPVKLPPYPTYRPSGDPNDLPSPPISGNPLDLPSPPSGNAARQSSGASWSQRSNVAPPPRSKPSALKVAAYAAGTVFAGGVLVGVGQAVYAGLIQGGVIEPIPGDHVYDIYRPSNNQ